MMLSRKIGAAFLPFVAAAYVLAAAGCEHKGPAEKAGERVDDAAKDLGDKMKDVGDKMRDAANGK